MLTGNVTNQLQYMGVERNTIDTHTQRLVKICEIFVTFRSEVKNVYHRTRENGNRFASSSSSSTVSGAFIHCNQQQNERIEWKQLHILIYIMS